MIYRKLGQTGISVSEIGLGCEHLEGKNYETAKAVVDEAIHVGINFLDVFMSQPQIRIDIGNAIQGRREKLVLQGHIGSVWKNGQYARSRDINECKHFFGDLLERLQTNYIDIGMLHFVDSQKDYDSVFHTEIIQYAMELKEKGIIRAIGMSSHNPVIARKAVETGLIDVLMFSLNVAYDLLPDHVVLNDLFKTNMLSEREIDGINPARAELYKTCERTGTAITVMKCFSGGMLVKEQLSPFGFALSPSQCIHYALTRPAVSSVLIGCISPEQIQKAVHYEIATEADKDFSSVLCSKPKYSIKGSCVYCNHCLPCPSKIDIAHVNKYLDLAVTSSSVPASVIEHYKAMDSHAENCIACGNCEKNCPFEVRIIERMEKARLIFGK